MTDEPRQKRRQSQATGGRWGVHAAQRRQVFTKRARGVAAQFNFARTQCRHILAQDGDRLARIANIEHGNAPGRVGWNHVDW